MDTAIKDDQKKEMEAIEKSLAKIKRIVLVLSGKGGVGKSTVAVNLATELAREGKRVGILDVDIHGPSIPSMLGLEGTTIMSNSNAIMPVKFTLNLSVMSIGFLLRNQGDAVIWRGPLKYSVIKQFITDVDWGELDYLVVDSPPGTGDEPLTIAQMTAKKAVAVIVTTPQRVSIDDVRKCVNFCRKLELPVAGIIENMSGFVCPSCGERIDIFDSGGGESLAKEMAIPFLGRIPIDTGVVHSCDSGEPYVLMNKESETTKAFLSVIEPILAMENNIVETENIQPLPNITKGEIPMKIAVPLVEGSLSMHFGHCDRFAVMDVDEKGTVTNREDLTPPAHEPGVLPAWLHGKGVTHIISSGMGSRAQSLFANNNIAVIVGAPSKSPEELASMYVAGTLVSGDNVCDH